MVPTMPDWPSPETAAIENGAPGFTVTGALVPEMAGTVAMVAVTVRDPAVLKVALNDPVPPVSVVGPVIWATGSVEVKVTPPLKAVARLPNWSRTVTVKPLEVPAVVLAGRPVTDTLVGVPGTPVSVKSSGARVP